MENNNLKMEPFNNVWEVLEDTPLDAEHMKIKCSLMVQFREIMKGNGWPRRKQQTQRINTASKERSLLRQAPPILDCRSARHGDFTWQETPNRHHR